ncbi:MAG: cobalamin-binding protein [Planctomycetes bacterium]|nr:cobalamin-binding protein [Planctomycetota bacterium]
MAAFPGRIVCLTEETTETLYLLGEGERVVGVSGYTVRPPEARLKPRVSAFVTARYDKILELKPDLVLAFSDLQADVVAELIRRGVNVFTFNQRSVAEILRMVLTVARIAGVEARGLELVGWLERELRTIADSRALFPRRPRVFFEEWKDPLISGIRWVEELIEVAGGEPVFPELRDKKSAKERVVEPGAVAARDPEVIIASWCGRKVQKAAIRSREGWGAVSAVRLGHIYEIASAVILQPGPAALTEGVRQIHAILATVVGAGVDPGLAPSWPLDRDLTRS